MLKGESSTPYLNDGRLWLEGFQNEVAVVMKVKLHNLDQSSYIYLSYSVSLAYPDTLALGLTILPTCYTGFTYLPHGQSPVFITNSQILNVAQFSLLAVFYTILSHPVAPIPHKKLPSHNKSKD